MRGKRRLRACRGAARRPHRLTSTAATVTLTKATTTSTDGVRPLSVPSNPERRRETPPHPSASTIPCRCQPAMVTASVRPTSTKDVTQRRPWPCPLAYFLRARRRRHRRGLHLVSVPVSIQSRSTSPPVSAASLPRWSGRVRTARTILRRTPKRRVAGSNPAEGTNPWSAPLTRGFALSGPPLTPSFGS
jgi:hypothetical protein